MNTWIRFIGELIAIAGATCIGIVFLLPCLVVVTVVSVLRDLSRVLGRVVT